MIPVRLVGDRLSVLVHPDGLDQQRDSRQLAKLGSTRLTIPPDVSLEHLYKPSIMPSSESDSIILTADPNPTPRSTDPGAIRDAVTVVTRSRARANPGSSQPDPGSSQPDPGATQPDPGASQPNTGAPQPEQEDTRPDPDEQPRLSAVPLATWPDQPINPSRR